LGPRPNDVKDLEALAQTRLAPRGALPEVGGRLALTGMSRLTGLAGAAEALQQELGAVSRRLQAVERDAESRRKLIAQAQRDGNEAQVGKLRTDQARTLETARQGSDQMAAVRDQFLRAVAALREGLDEIRSRGGPRGEDSPARGEILKLGLGEKAQPILSVEHVTRRLQELEKTIRTESVAIDVDKSILWVGATLNGKPDCTLIVDFDADDIRLPAEMARELGVLTTDGPGQGDGAVVELPLTGGRTVPAHRASLDSVQVGPFTASDVPCLVLSEACGDVPAVLGGSFLSRFAARADAGAAILVLTQVQLKPGSRTVKVPAAKAGGAPKPKPPGPAVPVR
jgi:predicted aspartyl protease